MTDEYFMRLALQEAQKAAQLNEVPVGAVVVYGTKVIARTHNQTEMLNDVTAHAEMLALTSATNFVGAKYLTDCTMYITLEPCPMCAAALHWAQVGKIVFGASDSKRGYRLFEPSLLHTKTEVVHGILEHECSSIVKSFFKTKR